MERLLDYLGFAPPATESEILSALDHVRWITRVTMEDRIHRRRVNSGRLDGLNGSRLARLIDISRWQTGWVLAQLVIRGQIERRPYSKLTFEKIVTSTDSQLWNLLQIPGIHERATRLPRIIREHYPAKNWAYRMATDRGGGSRLRTLMNRIPNFGSDLVLA